MNKTMLIARQDDMACAMRTMLRLQKEYFDMRKRGTQAPDHKAKCITAEYRAQSLLKELIATRPQIIEAEIMDMIKGYNQFLDRCKKLLVEQWNFFNRDRSHAQMKKCRALERDMRKRLTDYFTKQPQQCSIF